ncbi:ATP-binding protein [Bradyrhizobium cajani]|uniref:ATP-binding protein n=1 Tax=Bradyrhizobium cajani TaxID=1928661 RepID=UPI003221B5D3
MCLCLTICSSLAPSPTKLALCYILDRLMHHCHLLEFDGRSYRLKEAAEALARKTQST